MLDCHVHISGPDVKPDTLLAGMQKAGMDGVLLISLSPPSFSAPGHGLSAEQRLDNLEAWTNGAPGLYPFFWIDPMEDDALEQVGYAVSRGVLGFKCICRSYYPRDEKAMKVFHAIAWTGKPILFHSGILWDECDSSRFNRPAEFECLIGIPNLRFALAHISWPWCDEHIAVYGKIHNLRRHGMDTCAEMFVDTTPGTPVIYRRDALTKLFGVGYAVKHNVMFGSDQLAGDYNPGSVRELVERDVEIIRELNLTDETIDSVMGGNLKRFLGI